MGGSEVVVKWWRAEEGRKRRRGVGGRRRRRGGLFVVEVDEEEKGEEEGRRRGDRRITGACLVTSRKVELCEMASRRPHPGAQHLGAAPSSSPKKTALASCLTGALAESSRSCSRASLT